MGVKGLKTYLDEIIANFMNKKLIYEMIDFHSARPGHDLRYSLSGEKMKNMGWELPVNLQDSLKRAGATIYPYEN